MNVGYNLSTYKSHILFLIEQRFSGASSLHFTDALIFRMLNEAQREFQKRLRMGDSLYDHTIAMASNTARYDLPLDVLGGVIQEVGYFTDASADVWTPLQHIGLNRVGGQYREGGDLTAVTAGVPAQWALDEYYRKIIILPKASATAMTIGVRYAHVPSQPFRIYKPTDLTATVAYGASQTTVTINGGTPPDGNIIAAGGDEFGVVRTEQSDGSTVSHGEPHRWYKIASLTAGPDNINLEAETPFDEPSATALDFVVSQVLDIDKWHPGRFGWYIPLYAAGLLMQQSAVPGAAEISAQWRQEALAALEFMQRDEDGQFNPGVIPGGAIAGGTRLNV